MERRNFIQNAALATAFASLSPWNAFAGVNGEMHSELKKHKITKVERINYDYHWPRHVGKNARLDNHGQYNSDEVIKLHTDQGAMGWGLSRSRLKDKAYSPDGKWYVVGHKKDEKRGYTFYRFSDQVHFNSPMIPTYYGAGEASVTRIDGAPRWNRESNKILVGGVADDGSRQLFIIRIQPENE